MSKVKTKGTTGKIKYQNDGYLFAFPIVLMLAALIIYPMAYGFYISFFNTNLVTKWKFVGFKYYIEAFTDPSFYKSVLPMYGVLNDMLKSLGIISANISWLGSKELAFPSVVFTCIWKGFPLVMTMILAGLQSISKDLYEAAVIDGANKWDSFRYITLPSLKPILTTVIILDSVWWFKQYTQVFTMTAGGPGTATNLISLSIYGTAFNDLRFGKGAAWGILVFIICYLINSVYKVVLKDE